MLTTLKQEMRIYYLIFILSQFILISKAQQEGGDSLMPTPTSSVFNSTATDVATITNNQTTIGSMTLPLSFSPSPTTFVFTHFPIPLHTGSSSSMASTARPSQSAPFPDDTIGKYGRLHISDASHINYCCFCFVLLLISTTYIYI